MECGSGRTRDSIAAAKKKFECPGSVFLTTKLTKGTKENLAQEQEDVDW